MGAYGDLLVSRLDNAREWPLPEEHDVLTDIGLYIAFREGDSEVLREADDWENEERKYRVDSLPYDISEAFSNLIFGGPVKVTTINKTDQPNMDRILEDNDLSATLGVEHVTNSSEGEVWYRIFGDPDSDSPLMEWYSRTAVVPQFYGRRLVAVAFIDELEPLKGDPEDTRWRHFEIHERGEVQNVLYKGTEDQFIRLSSAWPHRRIRRTTDRLLLASAKGATGVSTLEPTIGKRHDLRDHPQTAHLLESWPHGLPGMLAGRVINKEGSTHIVGVSDYRRVKDYFFMLNESLAVGHENMRLTAKKRVVVESSALDASGKLDASQEVLVADRSDRMMGETPGSGPWRVLEYSFDAEALMLYKKDIVESACSRLGLQVEFVAVGDATQGFAQSGTALKVRLLPSVNAANGRAQTWDKEMPKALLMMQMLDALPEDQLGLGHKWSSDQASAPAFVRPETLPEDPTEETTRHVAAVEGMIMARKTAIQVENPEWDEQRVKDELDQIEEEQSRFGSSLATLFGGGASSSNGVSPSQGDAIPPTPAQAG